MFLNGTAETFYQDLVIITSTVVHADWDIMTMR